MFHEAEPQSSGDKQILILVVDKNKQSSNMEKVFQLIRRFHFLDIPQKRTPDVWAKSSNFLAVV